MQIGYDHIIVQNLRGRRDWIGLMRGYCVQFRVCLRDEKSKEIDRAADKKQEDEHSQSLEQFFHKTFSPQSRPASREQRE
jgi:hypothetical protein